jgi:hypothetical protein
MEQKSTKIKEFKKISSFVESVIEIFRQTVNDEAHLLLIEQSFANLNETIESIDKHELDQNDIQSWLKLANDYEKCLKILSMLNRLLNYEIKFSNLKLSENAGDALQKKFIELKKQIAEIEVLEFPKLRIERDDLIEIFRQYPYAIKHILDSTHDEILIEMMKQEIIINENSNELDADLYQNLIQKYGMFRLGEPVPFADLIESKFNIKKSKLKDLHKIANKHGAVLVFNESTNIDYKFYKLEKMTTDVSGVCREFIEKTDFIVRCDNQPDKGLLLYRPNGEIVDVVKLRQKNSTKNKKSQAMDMARELANEVVLIINSIDGENYCEMNLDKRHLFHLFYMPNHIATLVNNEIEVSIMNKYQGPRTLELPYISGAPIQHLRSSIEAAMMKLLERRKIKTKEKMDDFIHEDQISDIYINLTLDFFADYFSNKYNKVVQQECTLSLLSDVNRRCGKFRQNLNEYYSKARKGINESNIGVEFRKIVVESLRSTISEKDNVMKIMEEKKQLFI